MNKNELSGPPPWPFLFAFLNFILALIWAHDSPCLFPGCVYWNFISFCYIALCNFFLSHPGHCHSSFLQCPPFDSQHLSQKLPAPSPHTTLPHQFYFQFYACYWDFLTFFSAHLWWRPNSLLLSSIFLWSLFQACRIESVFKPSYFLLSNSFSAVWNTFFKNLLQITLKSSSDLGEWTFQTSGLAFQLCHHLNELLD